MNLQKQAANAKHRNKDGPSTMGIVSGFGMVAAVEMIIISKTQKNAKNVNQTERITSRKTNIQRSLYTSKV